MIIQRFNEHSLWQKDIREINDIINIARDDSELEVSVKSEIGDDIPKYEIRLTRSKEVFTDDRRRTVRWDDVLKDVPRYDFLNRSQNIVDRLRELDHNIIVGISYYTTDTTGGEEVEWASKRKISNPIDFAYHTNIYIISLHINISDIPPDPTVKKPWQFWK